MEKRLCFDAQPCLPAVHMKCGPGNPVIIALRATSTAHVHFHFPVSQVLPARIVVRNRLRVRAMAQANLEESSQSRG